jgi:carboxylesterase
MENAAPALVPGAEAWSHGAPPGDGPHRGFLALHGFTGNPSSMRGFAHAAAAAGWHVELPRLPGHGTTVQEMMTTGWDDWAAAADAAYQRLAARCEHVVVGGLSMGGALALWVAQQHPGVAALVCVNPATTRQGDDVIEMLEDFVAQGVDVVPGIGSDIADPDASESAYDGTPVRPLLSFMDGLAGIQDGYGEMRMPLLLWTSRQDHVVEPAQSERLAAEYGGPVDHRWLERSYHVATQDFDRDLIFLESIEWMSDVS